MFRADLKSRHVPPIWRWTGDYDLTEAQVNALIDTRLFGYTYRRMSMSFPVSSAVGGQRSAGFVDRAWGLERDITLPAGNNKIFEVVEQEVIEPGETLDNTMGDVWNQPFKYKMVQNCGNPPTIGPPVGEWCQGIQWGSFFAAPPFQSNFSAGNACLQLRYNQGTVKWELVIYDGDGVTPPTVQNCDIQPLFTPDLYVKELMLEYEPLSSPRVLKAYINGVLAKTYTGGRLETMSTGGFPTKAGYFVTSGSSGTGTMAETGFYHNAIYQPFSLPSPPNRF